MKYGLILSQAQPQNPNPGQAASTITEDGIAASEAVAQSIDKLWDDVLGGGLYSAIANLGIFFAVGTLLIFIVQWTKEMIDGDSSRLIYRINLDNRCHSPTCKQRSTIKVLQYLVC
ncbi:MAG: hypothetical protein WBA41_28030 [Rivularia sp. (in: cyanobacteria)]